LATRLRSLGYKNVRTLEGAFYQWASDGKPIVGDSGEFVYEVLPQHFLAALLLEKQIRTVAKKAAEAIGKNNDLSFTLIIISDEHLPIPELPTEKIAFSEPLYKFEKAESNPVSTNHSITIN
jgi:hypothetical protein